jgi:hypothetical protein
MFSTSLSNGIYNTVTFRVTADIIDQNDKPLQKSGPEKQATAE